MKSENGRCPEYQLRAAMNRKRGFRNRNLPTDTESVKRIGYCLGELADIIERLTREVFENPGSATVLLGATEIWLRSSAWLQELLERRGE